MRLLRLKNLLGYGRIDKIKTAEDNGGFIYGKLQAGIYRIYGRERRA